MRFLRGDHSMTDHLERIVAGETRVVSAVLWAVASAGTPMLVANDSTRKEEWLGVVHCEKTEGLRSREQAMGMLS